MNFIERLEKLVSQLVEKHVNRYLNQQNQTEFWKKTLGVEDTLPCSPSFEQLEALEFEDMVTNIYKNWGRDCA